jgi:hypothetical protein
LIWKQNFFANAFLSENRASKSYKDFIETYCIFQDIFDGVLSIQDILQTPYPVFRDIIIKQLERRKKQNEYIKQQQQQKHPNKK